MSTPRVRIAPSPTGFLHIGTARAALFNVLFARHFGGKFILRIEDTDLERSEKRFEENIFEGLRWLGINADESPEAGGDYGPYRQSERTGRYTIYIERLLAEGYAFYCFHSEQELEEEKGQLMRAHRPVLHMCEFRNLAPRDAELLKDTKQSFIIRFKTPPGRAIVFTDLIRGELSFESDLLGDFSIAKRVDIPLYNFAVVADDHDMQITHVIRGEDHIANTPKQILLIEALGFRQPSYAHLPLVLGTDRSKLSKRHGETSITEYRDRGYLPEALVNFIALLGWNPGDEREIMPMDEIIREFSLEQIQKSGAVFDLVKLDWMNGEYIRKKPITELAELCIPFLIHAGLLSSQEAHQRSEYIKKVVTLEQPRLKRLGEMAERIGFFFHQPIYEKELLRWKTMSNESILASLERAETIVSRLPDSFTAEEIEKIFLNEIGAGNKGSLLWPLRVALTGKRASPGPFEISGILGREEITNRLAHAKNLFKEGA